MDVRRSRLPENPVNIGLSAQKSAKQGDGPSARGTQSTKEGNSHRDKVKPAHKCGYVFINHKQDQQQKAEQARLPHSLGQRTLPVFITLTLKPIRLSEIFFFSAKIVLTHFLYQGGTSNVQFFSRTSNDAIRIIQRLLN
jgi:hypothetical protein